MIYLCRFEDDKLFLWELFETDQEFAAYLVGWRLKYILDHQRLTATDIYRKCECLYDTNQPVLYTHERDIIIQDEFGRILDARDFVPITPADDSIYNTWKKKQDKKFREEHRSRRQGKTHKKWGHYRFWRKYIPPDKELLAIDKTLRHRNRCLRNISPSYYEEAWKTTENNWKEQKVPHQYMWHKPRHKDTYLADAS